MRVCKVTIYDEYGTAHEHVHNNAAPKNALNVAVNKYDTETGASYLNAAKIEIGFVEKEETE